MMERLYYCAGSNFATGDDIAHALVDYARWVVARNEVDVVHVPTRSPDGSVGWTRLLLSSTTQISSETIASEGDELTDPELVIRLRAATTRLRLPHPAVAEQPSPELADVFEY